MDRQTHENCASKHLMCFKRADFDVTNFEQELPPAFTLASYMHSKCQSGLLRSLLLEDTGFLSTTLT